MTTDPYTPPPRPVVRQVTFADVAASLRAGLDDFRRAPRYGLFFGGVFAGGGILIFLSLGYFDQRWLIFPLAIGFPLAGPFAAAGLYEVSRRLQSGQPLAWRDILSVMVRQQRRELWCKLECRRIVWLNQAQVFTICFQAKACVQVAIRISPILTRRENNQVVIWVERYIGKRPLGSFLDVVRQMPTVELGRRVPGIIQLNPVRSVIVLILETLPVARDNLGNHNSRVENEPWLKPFDS